MKKLLSILLALALLLSLAGCVSPPEATLPTDTALTTEETTPSTAHTLPDETLETTEQDKIVPPDTRPAQTDPPETKPEQTDPPVTLPPQTDPIPTQPEQTDPQDTPTEPAPTQPQQPQPEQTDPPQTEPDAYLDPNGSYTTKEDVALYLHLYGRLPANFITKSEARSYGWRSGALERYAPGKCIGGDRFYNNEGLLPSGHTYYECDIDTLGSYGGRGAKRIVFSSDGLIYYTSDHYRTFTLLYGEP